MENAMHQHFMFYVSRFIARIKARYSFAFLLVFPNVIGGIN